MKVLVVDPYQRSVQPVTVNGYDDIKALFAPDADIEAGAFYPIDHQTMVNTWVSCDEFAVAPGWYSTHNPGMPLHGLSVINASSVETGESVDNPLTPEEFLATIVWEDSDSRIDPARPNQEWIGQFGTYPMKERLTAAIIDQTLPIQIGPYRLWKQDDFCGYYKIKPDASLAIWHVIGKGDVRAGYWAMVATDEGWQPLNVEPLANFAFAQDLVRGYCRRHGLAEG